MGLDMESDQICTQHPIQDLLRPWTDGECLWVGPRDMPEQGNSGIGPALFDQPGQEGIVIVLDEDERVCGPCHFLCGRLGKSLIHDPILLPVLQPKQRPGISQVAQRPKTFVGKTVVIAQLLLWTQPNPAQHIGRVIWGNAKTPVGIGRLFVGIPGGAGDPCPSAGAQDGFHCGHQATGRSDALNLAILPDVGIGFSVGDDQQWPALQDRPDMVSEPLGGPMGCVFQSEFGFFFQRSTDISKIDQDPIHLLGQGPPYPCFRQTIPIRIGPLPHPLQSGSHPADGPSHFKTHPQCPHQGSQNKGNPNR